jgi:tetratricopeptide (TPR) repeat protein
MHDYMTFAMSTITSLTFPTQSNTPMALVFEFGAPAYTFNVGNAVFDIRAGMGIVNNSSNARLDPNTALAYYNRAGTYYDLGKYAQAISDYNEAIRLDPNSAPNYCGRGHVYYIQGNRAKANADFATAERLWHLQ